MAGAQSRQTSDDDAVAPSGDENMRILLTFTGFHDPYTMELVGQEEQPGPILSLVGVRSFDHIILFSTPNASKNTLATRDALQAIHTRIVVEIGDIP
jgi:hypothetical protein